MSQSVPYQLLQRSLQRGRLGHAYLFTGDQLEDLEQAAAELVMFVNCQAPTGVPSGGHPLGACGTCSSCRRIMDRIHPDATWVRPESKLRQIQADQLRTLIHSINLKPMEAAHKAGIIVAADRMNVTAANVFLKTLEEPPPRSILILLSVEPQRLIETILSRCLRVHFGSGERVVDETIRAWLRGFAEQASLPNSGVMARYQLLGGLVTALQQLRIDIERQLESQSPLDRFPDASPDQKEKWEEELKAGIEAEYRRRRLEWLGAIHWWLRDIWLLTMNRPSDSLLFPELASASGAAAGRIQSDTAVRNLDSWDTTQRLLHTNVQEALALEVGLLKLQFSEGRRQASSR